MARKLKTSLCFFMTDLDLLRKRPLILGKLMDMVHISSSGSKDG